MRFVERTDPADVVGLARTGIDGGVLAFTLIVSIVTSLLFGLVPAFHASKVDLIEALKQGGMRSVVGGRSIGTRGVLVISEIALAVVLLTGGGLLMKSLMALHRVELGFQPAHVLVMTIVGVVGDVRQRNPALDPMPECYMPYLQHAYNSNTLNVVIRTASDPTALAGTVRRVAAEISPDVPVSFTTMDAMVSEGVEDPRFRALLFGLFAALAVCLAMAGVYGVMAYAVEQRSREIGVRIALGADKTSVLRLILGQGLVLACSGLVLGLAGAVVATRLLETVLFHVRPIDIQVYLGVIGLVAIVTLLAGYVPAWRAAVVNPVDVLKAG